MYRATIAADLNYDAWITEEESNISPWMKILCNPTIIKTFHFDKIDQSAVPSHSPKNGRRNQTPMGTRLPLPLLHSPPWKTLHSGHAHEQLTDSSIKLQRCHNGYRIVHQTLDRMDRIPRTHGLPINSKELSKVCNVSALNEDACTKTTFHCNLLGRWNTKTQKHYATSTRCTVP